MNLRNWKESASIDAFRADISRFPVLTKEQEERLVLKMKAGDEDARERLVMSQARLALVTAKKWATRNFTEDDAVAAAMWGVVQAVDRFELGRGARLSAYAMHYVKMRLRRESEKSRRAIALPMHFSRVNPEASKYVREYLGEHGQSPEPEHIVELFGGTYIQAQAVIAVNLTDASLNIVLGDDPHGVEWVDMIVGDAAAPDEAAEAFLLDQRIDRLMKPLDDREREVVARRFGLDGRRPEKLEDIGRDMGYSREYIRLLQNAALEKMARIPRREALAVESRAVMREYRRAS